MHIKRKLKSHKIINLLPQDYKQAQKDKKVKRILCLFLIFEVMGYIGKIVVLPKIEEKLVNRQLDEMTKELLDERYDRIYEINQALEKERQELTKWKGCYQQLVMQKDKSWRILEHLLTRVPSGVYINQLSIEDQGDEEKHIYLEGIAKESNNAINYQAVLEEAFGMRTVTCLLEWDEKQQVYQYKMEVSPNELLEEINIEEGEE